MHGPHNNDIIVIMGSFVVYYIIIKCNCDGKRERESEKDVGKMCATHVCFSSFARNIYCVFDPEKVMCRNDSSDDPARIRDTKTRCRQ